MKTISFLNQLDKRLVKMQNKHKVLRYIRDKLNLEKEEVSLADLKELIKKYHEEQKRFIKKL